MERFHLRCGRMNRVCVLVALSLALMACGDDDGGEDVPLDEVPGCDEVFVDGATLSLEEASATCRDENGGTQVYGTASVECVDGRTLHWNDRAWWFAGEGISVYDEGDEQVPPASVMDDCS